MRTSQLIWCPAWLLGAVLFQSPALIPCFLFLCRVWYWGYISFYDSGGYIQELGTSLEEGRAQLNYLQQHSWIDNM